jgi:RNA polymerase sigma-70 factor (ECF subfamily)
VSEATVAAVTTTTTVTAPPAAGDAPALAIAKPGASAPGAATADRDADAALVAASRRGDAEAFEELVRRTARLVYARAYLETGNRHRAEDLVQETFLTAWRKIGQLSDPSGFRAWLMTILHSTVVDAARRASRKKRKGRGGAGGDGGETEMLRLADPAPTPAELVETTEQRQRALSILRSLPREYQQVLMLRYLAGADYETIARQLALSNGSLRGLLHRGLALLRKEFEGK